MKFKDFFLSSLNLFNYVCCTFNKQSTQVTSVELKMNNVFIFSPKTALHLWLKFISVECINIISNYKIFYWNLTFFHLNAINTHSWGVFILGLCCPEKSSFKVAAGHVWVCPAKTLTHDKFRRGSPLYKLGHTRSQHSSSQI